MKTKTEWQAVRILHDLTNQGATIEVQLGFPEPSENELWRCAFRVKGLTQRKIGYGIGCDALKALMTALDGISLQLRESGRRFKWIDLEGESGVRRQIPIFLGPEFADEIEAHIEKKIESFVTDREKSATKRARAAKKHDERG
jgi:hypothetical protein